MKHITLVAILFSTLEGLAQVSLPAASPTQTIVQKFGTGSIEITYSRPSVKGRVIFGGLETWGKVWRMGANEATRIRFTFPIQIANTAIDTGTYALYAIPNENEWTIILNKGTKNWGAQGYAEIDDVVRFEVKPQAMSTPIETMAIQLTNFTNETCEFEMIWERTRITFTIQASLRDTFRKKVEDGLSNGQTSAWTAAEFYFHWDKDYKKSLEFAKQALALAEGKGRKVPWMYLLKAKNELALNDKAAAKASAEKCVQLARETNFESYANQGLTLLKQLK
jgi:hypothetical protein